MVRDEVDIVRLSVLHHLSGGVDHVLVVDNGSTDGTTEILGELGRDPRITWWRDESPWNQAEMLTDLAREAYRRGADWVVPFDADEFWLAPEATIREVLSGTSASALQVPIVNFVQSRSRLDSGADALLSMTRHSESPVGPFERTRELVESRQIAFVEMMYPSKFVSRPGDHVELGMGNHSVAGLSGHSEETTDLICFHAPLRSRAALEQKAERGRRMDSAGWPPDLGWHARHFGRVLAEGRLDEEWAANSYDEAGYLDVFGERRELVEDFALRDLVAPFVDSQQQPLRRRLLGPLSLRSMSRP
jgi:glycosyltransferase involved in cell wall biosynthesis